MIANPVSCDGCRGDREVIDVGTTGSYYYCCKKNKFKEKCDGQAVNSRTTPRRT